MIRPLTLAATLLCMAAATDLYADVKLPRIFADHMVLQRNKPVHVWGWAAPNEQVTVSIGTAVQRTTTGRQGRWEVFLPPLTAGGPHTIVIKGKNTIQLQDVLVGEVWVCSGQSNMEWPLRSAANANAEIAAANYPMIRQFSAPHVTELTPQEDVKSGEWKACSLATAGDFTAVGYFFARELYKELNVPIGLINTNWGGTNVETWISRESFFGEPQFTSLKSSMPVTFDSVLRVKQAAFDKMLNSVQPGLPSPAEERTFAQPAYNDAGWKTMKLPSHWENAGLPNLDGEVWFRKEIIIPEGTKPGTAILSLGPIDDNDSTFVNGVLAGVTNRYDEPRHYQLAEGMLKPGRNVIAIKVFDGGGGGGLYAVPGQMKLQLPGSAITLEGDWKFRIARHQSVSSIGPNEYPTLLYNSMIHPFTGYPIAGFIWYQGESNTGRAVQYKTSFPLMIKDWRKQWKEELPFYFVQLANFNTGNGTNQHGGSTWAELREAQAQTLRLPNTGMAVTIDIGESNDIHPRNKQDVGKRLAANALAKTYGRPRTFSGPTFQSMQVEGDKAILSFSHAAGGFDIRNKYGYINGFEIAGADGRFYYAKAFAEGEKIVVFCDKVAKPAAVRYAWADDPNDVNLFNKEGFPAAPFRTDQWKARTEGERYGF